LSLVAGGDCSSVLYLSVLHYNRVEQLRLIPSNIRTLDQSSNSVVVPSDDVNYASLRADVRPVPYVRILLFTHLPLDTDRVGKVQQKMRTYAPDLELVVRSESPVTVDSAAAINVCKCASQTSIPGLLSVLSCLSLSLAHWWEGFPTQPHSGAVNECI